MRAGLDTSIVLRLVVGEPAAQAEQAWKFVTETAASREGPVVLSDLVVAEAYFALRHHYLVPHAVVLDHLRALLKDERVHASGSAETVVAQGRSGGSAIGFVDRLIHADYRRDGARLVTFDRAVRALDGVELLEA